MTESKITTTDESKISITETTNKFWFMNSPHKYYTNIKCQEISSTIIRDEIKKNNYSTNISTIILKYIQDHNLYN